MATVLVVYTESTLQKGAINALVLTALDVSLEDARSASTVAIELSLATVKWRQIAILVASLASKETGTRFVRVDITIADCLANKVTSDGVNRIAVDPANAFTAVLGSSLATVTPITIVIDAGVRRALVNGALPIKGGTVVVLGTNGLTSGTREGRAVHAFANTAALRGVEDALTTSLSRTLTSVDFTTVGTRKIAIETERVALERASTSLGVALGGGRLVNEEGQSRVGSKSQAISTIRWVKNVLQGSVARTLGVERSAVSGRIFATVIRDTVAILETILASEVAH
jgi:hypothetical protein